MQYCVMRYYTDLSRDVTNRWSCTVFFWSALNDSWSPENVVLIIIFSISLFHFATFWLHQLKDSWFSTWRDLLDWLVFVCPGHLQGYGGCMYALTSSESDIHGMTWELLGAFLWCSNSDSHAQVVVVCALYLSSTMMQPWSNIIQR